jgi:hypothetical protein
MSMTFISVFTLTSSSHFLCFVLLPNSPKSMIGCVLPPNGSCKQISPFMRLMISNRHSIYCDHYAQTQDIRKQSHNLKHISEAHNQVSKDNQVRDCRGRNISPAVGSHSG